VVVWAYAGNVVERVDGLHPSYAPHEIGEMLPKVFPGVRYLGEVSRVDVLEWDPWQYYGAEADAINCAGGDFLLP
jgi:hypothetical protein